MDRSASELGSASLPTHGALTHVICQDATYALAVLSEEPAHAVHLRGSKHKPDVRIVVLLQPRQTNKAGLHLPHAGEHIITW